MLPSLRKLSVNPNPGMGLNQHVQNTLTIEMKRSRPLPEKPPGLDEDSWEAYLAAKDAAPWGFFVRRPRFAYRNWTAKDIED